MSDKKLYQITKKQTQEIREALSACDGEWWVSVRWDEIYWEGTAHSGVLFGSDGFHVQQGIEGLEIALCFSPETTRLGDVHKALECSGIRGVRFAGKQRIAAKITDLTQLEHCPLVQSLAFRDCVHLVDISVVTTLPSLTSLELYLCDQLTELSILSSLSNLQTLSFTYRNPTTDISILSSLTSIKKLTLCGIVEEVSILSSLQNLQILTLRNNRNLVDISALSNLSEIHTLDLSNCRSLGDIQVISYLTNIHVLNLSSCSLLKDTSILSSLKNLERLDLSTCRSLTDLQGLSSLTNLKELNLNGCGRLQDLSPLSGLNLLHTLSLGGRSRLAKGLLTDISPLSSLTDLTNLTIIHCQYLVEISSLANLTNLTLLDLTGSSTLSDISPISSLEYLVQLTLARCMSLSDIAPLSSLNQLQVLILRECELISDISPLSSLKNIQYMNLSGCIALTNLSALKEYSNMYYLSVSNCTSLSNIVGISKLPKLRELSVSGCNELADYRTWLPLTTIPSLKYIQGPFPSYFITKIVARNAANNTDWPYIDQNLLQWQITAAEYATEPNLLTQVGRAAAIHHTGYEVLANIITLSTTNDAPEIDKLFTVAVSISEHDVIGTAIQSAIEQAESPLPPETLIALHDHVPNETGLRDNTIVALTRSMQQDSIPEWGEKTAKVLREQLNDNRYPITSSIHDNGFLVLANQQFTSIQSLFFGVLCSGHARSTNTEWRNHFHSLLCGLALSQSDVSTRNQALSDISSGLSICSDETWVQDRLDYLLKAAAEIDPDTSVIYAAVAYAHAIGKRWDEAQETVSSIASPSIRDKYLKKISAMVLDSNQSDKIQRAISLIYSLSTPIERAQKLYELGFHEGLLDDLVAYGQLVGLLTEFPEKQKEVVAHVIEQRPEMTEPTPIQVPQPNAMAKKWLNLIKRVTPEQYEHILSEYQKNPF